MKNFSQLACKFHPNQSEGKLSKVNTSAHKAKPCKQTCKWTQVFIWLLWQELHCHLMLMFWVLFLNERDVLNKWHRDCACDVCVCNFTSGVDFCGQNFAKTFFLQELIFADHGKSAKIKTAKIFCCTACRRLLEQRPWTALQCRKSEIMCNCLFVSTNRH